jgi:hypothetical protein
MTGGGTSGAVTLNVIGSTGITANANNIAIDATVATLAGTQTFTNKSGSNDQWTNDAGYTTNTGTTTASNTQTFTNKSGNISQWTNDSGYLTSAGDITGVTAGAGLSGGGTTGTVTVNVDYAGNDNIILAAVDDAGTQLEEAFKIIYSDTSNNVLFGNVSDLPFTGNVGDITAVVAGTGISGGGTSGSVTITNSAPNIVQTTVTGNAGTATKLATARNIAGVSFDGSANISLNNNAITNGAGYITSASLQGVPAILSNGTTPSLNTGISGAEVRSLIGAGTSSLAIGITASTAMVGNTVTITDLQADAIVANSEKVGITSGQASAITANTAKVGITSGQASEIIANTTKVGITTTQASNITTNNAKVGITSGQASAITANTAKTGITSGQASAITANTAKVGISTGQASAITANTAKVTDTGVPAILSDGSQPQLNTNMTPEDVRNLIEAGQGTSDLVIGTTATTAKAGNITTISSAQASAITANTAKVGITSTQASNITTNNAKTGITSTQASNITTNNAKVTDTGRPAILSDGTEPSLNSGMTEADIRSLIGAGQSNLTIGTTSSTAKAGNITTISTGQASAITANTAKTGITSGQASAITANTAKTGISSGQASAITANTAKVGITSTQAANIVTNNGKTGITSGQASAITANTSKTGITSGQASAITANTAKTGITSGQASAITANTAKDGITSGQASAITANTAKVTDTGTPAILSNGSEPSLNTNMNAQEIRDLIGAGTGSSDLVIGTTSTTAKAGDITTISTGQASAITANTAKTGISSGQASAITANTAKVGITSTQASNITTNNAKTGITSGQASAITANTAKTGITSGQASAITANTAKVGITSTQASNITTNNAKVSNVTQTTVTGNAGSATVLQNARTIAGVSFNGSANISLNNNAITNGAGYTTNTGDITAVVAGAGLSGGANSGSATVNVDYAGTDNIILTASDAAGTQVEDSGFIMYSDTSNNVVYAQVSDLPFGQSNLSIGTTSTTAKAGNTTTITTTQATAISLNTAKVTDTGTPAILSNGSAPSLNSGISAAEVRSLIGAGTSSTTGTATSVGLVVNNGAALAVGGSPVTSSGTLELEFAGSDSEYIQGNGELASFPQQVATYTPDIWQVNAISNVTSARVLVADTVRIVNGTTNTSNAGSVAGTIRIVDAGTYQITYAVQIRTGSGITTRQVLILYINAGGTPIPGSTNSTYLRLLGANQGGYAGMFNSSYATVSANTDIELYLDWLDGNNKKIDVYNAESIQNTISILRIK